MNNQTFTTRRGGNATYESWTSSRYVATNQKKGMSKYAFTFIVILLTGIFGLIYVAQGTKASGFDYQISEVESQIAEMNAKKEDLAVEQARLTSLASAKNSEVAKAMEDGQASGYANN